MITRIALKLFLENMIRPPTDLVNNNDDAPSRIIVLVFNFQIHIRQYCLKFAWPGRS